MKKKIAWTLLGIVMAVFLLGLAREDAVPEEEALALTARDMLVGEEDLKIWVVTDLHYLAPELFDDGEAFQRIKATAAGKDLPRVPALMQALVWEARQEKPDLLIVSGDLTFNGEYQSAQELAEYFGQIEEAGTQVAVIPGNHDIHSGWARKYAGEYTEVVDQITPEDFRLLFADFGYDLAITQDPHSLSYVIEPKEGHPLLMLDTNIYTEEESTKAPIAEGAIRPETYEWLQAYADLQKEGPVKTYLVAHHNLMAHSGREREGILVEKADEARNFFASFGVQTIFSGHIHAQDIAATEVEEQPLYEIVTGALSIHPNSMGEVTLSDGGMEYQHRSLDVEGWARSASVGEEELLQYSQTGQDFFREDGAFLGLQMMFEEQWYEEAYKEPVMSFIGHMNVRYFSGLDYVPEGDSETVPALQADPGYQIIQENSETFLKRYSNQLLEDTNLYDRELKISY